MIGGAAREPAWARIRRFLFDTIGSPAPLANLGAKASVPGQNR